MNVSIYLDKTLIQRLRKSAKSRHLSVSHCIRKILEKGLDPDLPSRPLKDVADLGISLGGNALMDTEKLYE